MELSLLLASTTILALVVSLAWVLFVQRSNVTPKQKRIKTINASLTFRISNIPRKLTKDRFGDILFDLNNKFAPSDIAAEPNVASWSYTPAAACDLSGRFSVATVTFRIPPALGELERGIKSEIGIEASRLKVDVDFFGLTPLADPGEDATVDIIAVTGLAGHAFGSWKSKGRPEMWLRDFLPETVPSARILTYGYDTKLPGSQSEASILELSRRFLESIKTTRDLTRQNRPTIFIAHSLGGLVVKQALVDAAEGSPEDKALFMSCSGVVLFGVPNRGLDNKSLMAMVKGQPNEELVGSLSVSSRSLSLLHTRFNNSFTLDGSKIISVFETHTTPTVEWSKTTGNWERTGPKVMMVPHTSASYAGPHDKHYDQLSIDANHSDIVKFSDESNPDYLIIQTRIKNLVVQAPHVVKERFATYRQSLSELEKRYMESLQAPDYDSFRNYKIADPTPGTLGWFMNTERFHSWHTSDHSSMLWVKGSAGQGKTILTKFLLSQLESSLAKSNSPATVIYFFFYDQDDHLRTISAALRSLIKQLLLVKGAFQVISDKFNDGSSSIPEGSLWAILEEMLRSPVFKTVYCVIDALDECSDEVSRQRFLELLKKIVQSTSPRDSKFPVFKALLTSRPTVALSRELYQCPFIHLMANPQDLATFIHGQIEALRLDNELREVAINLLTDRVEQTFLWISIILNKLRAASTLLSHAAIERIIKDSPSDLTQLYEGIVNQIMQSNDTAQQKLLTWAVYGRRALTIPELQEALSVQEDSDSIESAAKHRIRLDENNITSAAGVILEVREGKVSLIHQSAKEFLVKSEHLAAAVFCKSLHPSAYLAKICMVYLCFKDFQKGPCGSRQQLDERKRRYPFLYYAARNWHRHIRNEDDTQGSSDLIYRLTEPGSQSLLVWGEVAEVSDLGNAANIWDVATKANIPWLAEFFHSGDTVVGADKIKDAARLGVAGYNTLEPLARKRDVIFTKEAVLEVARHFDQGMMQIFLNRNDTSVAIPVLMGAAAANEENGTNVMRLLLQSHPNLEVTSDLIEVVALNKRSGKDIMELLLRKDVNISDEALRAIVELFPAETTEVLLSAREDFKIDDAVLESAAENRDRGHVIQLLLDHRGQDIHLSPGFVAKTVRRSDMETLQSLFQCKQVIHITNDIIVAAACNRNAVEVLKSILEYERGELHVTSEIVIGIIVKYLDEDLTGLFLQRGGPNSQITKDIIKTVVDHHDSQTLMKLLPDHTEQEINEDLLAAIASLVSEKEMEIVLERGGQPTEITESVFIAAASNWKHGFRIFDLLLEQEHQVQVTEGVFVTIASRFDDDMMSMLLEHVGRNFQITENIVRAAVRNEESGTEIIQLLLQYGGQSIRITNEIIKGAINNEEHGAAMIKLLLEHDSKDIQFTEDLMKIAANGEESGAEIMQLLLEHCQYVVTEEILEIAANDMESGVKMIELLLDHVTPHTEITESVFEIAVRNEKCGLEIIKLLLSNRGRPDIKITENIIKAAICNEELGDSIVELLLEHEVRSLQVTEELLRSVVSNEGCGSAIMKLFIKHWSEDVMVTRDILKVAATNKQDGVELIVMILNHGYDKRISLEELVEVAAGSNFYGYKVMGLFTEEVYQNTHATEGMIKAAAGNMYCDDEVVKLFLNRAVEDIQITEEIVKAAAADRWNGAEKMYLLFKHGEQHIQITQSIIETAAGNYEQGPRMIEFLLEKYGKSIQVTEGMLKAAACNEWSGTEAVELLLKHGGQNIRITEETMKAAVTNEQIGLSLARLLLNHQGEDWQVTEDIVKTAARNERSGPAILKFFLDHEDQDIQITKDIVNTAAGNNKCGAALIELLIEYKGQDLHIGEDTIQIAAGNEWSGTETLDLLLTWTAQHISVTEDIIIAAANNWESGDSVMELLFEYGGDDIHVTEDIMVAAAGNEWTGTEVMKILLGRQGKDIPVTQKIIEAAAANKECGVAVRKLLASEAMR